MSFFETVRELADEIIAFSMVGATIVCVVTGKSVPDWFVGFTGVIITYYFTRKNGGKK